MKKLQVLVKNLEIKILNHIYKRKLEGVDPNVTIGKIFGGFIRSDSIHKKAVMYGNYCDMGDVYRVFKPLIKANSIGNLPSLKVVIKKNENVTLVCATFSGTNNNWSSASYWSTIQTNFFEIVHNHNFFDVQIHAIVEGVKYDMVFTIPTPIEELPLIKLPNKRVKIDSPMSVVKSANKGLRKDGLIAQMKVINDKRNIIIE